MFGITDTWVALAYVLCIASGALCVGYGLLMWNRGDEPVKQEDVKWVEEQKQEEAAEA